VSQSKNLIALQNLFHFLRKKVGIKGKVLSLFVMLFSNNLFSGGESYIFKQIAPSNELAQAWVTAISQDFLGFIWIGTSDGLYRYDGYKLKTFRSIPGSQNTLIGNNITAILEDSQQNLWVACTKGISIYDRNTDRFYYAADWPRENVSCIVEDAKGSLFFGSYAGLYLFNREDRSFERYDQYNDDSAIYSGNQLVFINNENKILVCGPHGISEFDKEKESFSMQIRLPEGISGTSVASICEDYKGTVWLGTREHGLFFVLQGKYNQLKRLNLPANHFLIEGSIISMLQNSDSTLWLGSENNGIALIDLRDFYRNSLNVRQITTENVESSLQNNSIYSLFSDRQSNIWIGTYGGLNFYNPIYSNFQHVKVMESGAGLNNDIINGFFEEGEDLWIETEGGINIQNKITGKYRYLIHDPKNSNSLSSNPVYAITKDLSGLLWIGTWSGGINRFDPITKEIKHFFAVENSDKTIINNNIFSLITDEHGDIWIGTMGGGLDKYNYKTGTFIHYLSNSNDPTTISNNWVRQVYLDSRGRLWVSTYNSLEIMDRKKESFYHFVPDENDSTSISDNGAIVIFEDSRKHMWFGTETGLHIFNESDSSFAVYRTSDGLPSNVINAILEDATGNFWLSTNNGITKFEMGIDLPANPVFVTYDIRDGLQGNRFNQRSAYRDSEGYLYFGGKNGFNRFNPEALKQDTNIPPVIITEFLISNKTEVLPGSEDAIINRHITLADEIQLKYKYRVFTINFVALNYLIPEKNQYKYRLEGFEDNWNDNENKHSATYTNLDPGEYIFKVIASNNNNIWNEKGASLKIVILPPWYRTQWAYAGYFSIILLLVLTFRRFIVIRTQLKHELVLQQVEKEKLDQVNKMKTRFFTNISHEFRTPLTLIISPLESLLSDINIKPAINRQLNGIQKNARRLLRLINQLLDISEIEADHLRLQVSEGDIAAFIKEIASLFRWLAGQKQINYSFISNKNHYQGYFDRDKVEKICYNLIANAFKYTPSNGKISVLIEIMDDSGDKYDGYLKLQVVDSGIGIDETEKDKIFEHFYRTEKSEIMSKDGSGIGLALVRGLVNVYRGNIDVKSSEGLGTEFTVHLPLNKSLFEAQEIIGPIKEEAPPTLDIYDLEQGFSESSTSQIRKEIIKETHDSDPVMLIVEDHEELRTHLAEHFSANYSVLEAGNGEEALAIAQNQIPDIIISDIRMPLMDGIELCKRLKKDEKTSHIPVVLLTAKASDKDRLSGLDTGADAYITKPFETKLLMVTVKNLIESRRLLKEKYSRSLLIEPSEISITSLDEKFLKKALAIVEKNIANAEYSVDTFSKDIGMSRSHLHRKFIGLTGLSPSGFIRILRMKRAALLLTKGQLTVSEILFEIGIKSRSYFTKSFKEQFGESPTEFAAKNKTSFPGTINFNLTQPE
jgi:signal transduction histidine kinase/ligand-binding sensor domain-containing protein/DNA-binding response OmpR family regulator